MSAAGLITFRAIRGHDRQRDVLRAAVVRDHLPPALLFAGPEGVGKHAVTLALVAWLQCEAGGDDACGRCRSCCQVAAGSHPDVQQVATAPGKKEIGVDRVREVKRMVQLQPVLAKAKVAIIDDAHTLTVAAQNALLKTLEDPPSRSLAILVSSNPDALLPTVRSRCQRVRFFPLPTDVVADILVSGHGLDAARAAELAALAGGSPGRALMLRGCLEEDGPELLQQLARLGASRYVQLMRLASQLDHPENQTVAKLEMLLSGYRDEAVRVVGAEHLAVSPAARTPVGTGVAGRTILRRADAVGETCNALRRGNANRHLLLEALLLRLARS